MLGSFPTSIGTQKQVGPFSCATIVVCHDFQAVFRSVNAVRSFLPGILGGEIF